MPTFSNMLKRLTTISKPRKTLSITTLKPDSRDQNSPLESPSTCLFVKKHKSFIWQKSPRKRAIILSEKLIKTYLGNNQSIRCTMLDYF